MWVINYAVRLYRIACEVNHAMTLCYEPCYDLNTVSLSGKSTSGELNGIFMTMPYTNSRPYMRSPNENLRICGVILLDMSSG